MSSCDIAVMVYISSYEILGIVICFKNSNSSSPFSDIRKAQFNQRSVSDSRDSATDSTVPAKPPRRRSTRPKKPRDKFARAVNSMANLDMPVLLTIQDSD